MYNLPVDNYVSILMFSHVFDEFSNVRWISFAIKDREYTYHEKNVASMLQLSLPSPCM